ncbi:MAG: cyclic di-AMP binding protein CbpA [Lactobacillus sp.]|jgi:CBS domain-containing protein|uniref:Cyclic di-AMP binding protein CbpA n=1 Tax=Lacticaseibacillus suilingensis TaxID=2799577 RepID=A0ABW4BH48_9LACO|nr:MULTISPECIES: cyclic di-AMP binding protein CbpA [Lacticaseibacillus]MCI1893444.1 cyclic di-AMP binding protein CbpA [Lactobacillus sp.]MCI1917046.1 cyclic di-AMP binding protein CbpA [Lactobacillus sp.]MCI1941049.1 cyclic di-AMP binding protein CbpA [Lactobacillus sp.]MCI1971478.1 cyclic di-AMP binding protein CbpA [Lactobacillus sp.]MCI2017448.1 cyclic di-AMP binding protein CbpA [Lactobacillus sp.]
MVIKSLIQKKDALTTVKETVTLEEALKTLEDSGFRCVPIVDESGQIFRGNIYKMHIYRHKSQGGDMTLPVTYLLKNATKTIPIDAPFFKVFFNIKDLPYIAVLDENANFYGILTHARLLAMLSESWNIDVGSYVLTVMSTGARGDLAAMSKILAKYVSISGCLTLDAKQDEIVRRTLFTLPAGIDENTLNECVARLERKGFRVAEIDDLQSGQPLRIDEEI